MDLMDIWSMNLVSHERGYQRKESSLDVLRSVETSSPRHSAVRSELLQGQVCNHLSEALKFKPQMQHNADASTLRTQGRFAED